MRRLLESPRHAAAYSTPHFARPQTNFGSLRGDSAQRASESAPRGNYRRTQYGGSSAAAKKYYLWTVHSGGRQGGTASGARVDAEADSAYVCRGPSRRRRACGSQGAQNKSASRIVDYRIRRYRCRDIVDPAAHHGESAHL